MNKRKRNEVFDVHAVSRSSKKIMSDLFYVKRRMVNEKSTALSQSSHYFSFYIVQSYFLLLSLLLSASLPPSLLLPPSLFPSVFFVYLFFAAYLHQYSVQLLPVGLSSQGVSLTRHTLPGQRSKNRTRCQPHDKLKRRLIIERTSANRRSDLKVGVAAMSLCKCYQRQFFL